MHLPHAALRRAPQPRPQDLAPRVPLARAREETSSEEPDEDRREHDEDRDADREIADTEKNL